MMDKETLTLLANMHNALRTTHPTQEDILIIGDVIRGLRAIVSKYADGPENKDATEETEAE